jgi:Ca2+-binding EF-hand superfamily protein
MSVSSINPSATFLQANAMQGESNSSSTRGTTGTNTAGASASSTQVTLSPQAQAVAKLASAGITMTQTKLSAQDLADVQSGNFSQLASDLAASGTAPSQNGEISEQAFDQFALQLGATQTQANQLFKDFDTNGDGSISNAEMLQGVAGTSSDTSSSFSQTLLGLMDGHTGNPVSQQEFVQFETGMVGIEKSAG